ncbi:hypothetical protein SB2_11845 [Methylobacterium radiotolerans]|nr:hypothetical protein SB3_11040 [Methylobacterium radiotolerans]KTS47984.1 hypothetical protein SB2_11845 [Methylobacterium radiotolerans]
MYAGQVPRALDNLLLGRFAMVGLAKLSEAVLGTNTVVPAGAFAVTPGGGLNIAIGPGQVYQLESIEPTTESALNTDGHQVLKQGVALDAQTITLTPPSAAGYAQNFLIQVAYADIPAGSTVLSFQNPTPVLDPSTNAYKYVTYPGPGGNGAQSYTILQGGVSVIPKAGTAAPAGSQSTPSPDPGYVGLYVVTLAFGVTSISSGNIAGYSGAPFIPTTLPGVPAGVQAGSWTYGVDVGSADNYVVNLSPNTGSISTGQRAFVKFANANATTSPVINVNGTGAKALVKSDGTPLKVGDVAARWKEIFYDGASWRFTGAAPSDAASITSLGAAKVPFNEVIIPITQRVSMSLPANSAGQFVTALSGIPYTKQSATSRLVVQGAFTCFSPIIVGQGAAAVTHRLRATSGSTMLYDETTVTTGYYISNTNSPCHFGGSPLFVIDGLPAGNLTLDLLFKRDDNLAWSTILNPNTSDVPGYPTPNNGKLLCKEEFV